MASRNPRERKLSRKQRRRLLERVEVCPCWCGDYEITRDDGWYYQHPIQGSHNLLWCTEFWGEDA